MKKVLFLMKIREDHSNNYTPAIFQWYGVLERLGYEVFYEDYSSYDPENFYQLVKEMPGYEEAIALLSEKANEKPDEPEVIV